MATPAQIAANRLNAAQSTGPRTAEGKSASRLNALRRRYMRLEAAITNQALAEMEPCDNPLGALYLSDGPGARALERARRHYEAAQRAWLTAFKHLQAIRQQQSEDALAMALHAPMPEIGFVPENINDNRREAPHQSPVPSPQHPVPISETRSEAPPLP